MTTNKGVRLLIVDDETAQMQALCDTLEDQGYEVLGCSHGAAALAPCGGARSTCCWPT